MNNCPGIVFIILLLTPISLGSDIPLDGYMRTIEVEAWKNWKTLHLQGHHKLDVEEPPKQFSENYKKMIEHNERYVQGGEFYQKGLNKFSATRVKDVLGRVTRKFPNALPGRGYENVTLPLLKLPPAIDWRIVRGVDPIVRDQGGFPHGWLFASVEVVQSQVFVRTEETMRFSPQVLLDCMQDFGYKCGFIFEALQYIRFRGIATEEIYPFRQIKQRFCPFNLPHVPINVQSVNILTPGDEDNLKRAIAAIGPIAVKLYVTENFVAYSFGIFYDETCTSDHPTNHAVLLLGYGTDPLSGDFWIIKNSWGPLWGENGYMRMSRNTVYNCGITTFAIYPIVD